MKLGLILIYTNICLVVFLKPAGALDLIDQMMQSRSGLVVRCDPNGYPTEIIIIIIIIHLVNSLINHSVIHSFSTACPR